MVCLYLKLDINEIKDVIIQVEYIENSIYAGSIGIDNATFGTDDEQEFSGFSTTKQSSVIYVTVNKTNVIINNNFFIISITYSKDCLEFFLTHPVILHILKSIHIIVYLFLPFFTPHQMT